MALSEGDQQIADLVATNAAVQLMLRYLFELQFADSTDPQKFRAEAIKQLVGLVDTSGLPALKPEVTVRVREQMKFLITTLLTNTPLPKTN